MISDSNGWMTDQRFRFVNQKENDKLYLAINSVVLVMLVLMVLGSFILAVEVMNLFILWDLKASITTW